jgi:hypothetical protein
MEQVSIITPVEQVVGALPLGQSPIGRVVLGLGLGISIAYFVRPSMSFYPDGRPRPWILTDSKNVEGTIFPYWAYPLVPAILLGVLL